ncbi:MAG: hypothetical protein K2Q01_11555 [Rickettsiales bacterium]|nr:hypothetical protein [Rickettsiales bacterium]
MREMEDEDSDRHPALKNFSRTSAYAKHVLGGGFRGALIGGAAGAGILAGGAALLTAGAVAATGPIGWILGAAGLYTGVGTGLVASTIGAAAVTGATYGAGIGAGAGALFSLSGASDAVDAEEEKIILAGERAELRDKRLGRLREAHARQAGEYEALDAHARSQNPNRGLPHRGGMMGGPAHA